MKDHKHILPNILNALNVGNSQSSYSMKHNFFISLIFSCIFSYSTQAQFNIVVQGDSIWAIDAVSNDTIIYPQITGGLWRAFNNPNPYPALAPQRKITVVGNGYNISYSYQNTSTTDTFSLGELWPANINMDSTDNSVGVKLFLTDNQDNYKNTSCSNSGALWNTCQPWKLAVYPQKMYSPCIVMVDSILGYTIGISLLYPVQEYEHMVQFNFDMEGDKWQPNISLNNEKNIGPMKYLPESELLPGLSREYKVCVRIIKNTNPCAHWLQTLLPYKAYFREMYGGVTYNKDSRPIAAFITGNTNSNDSINNPYRFDANILVNNNLRPDIHGYGPFSHYLAGYKNMGFDRTMIYLPTGKPFVNRQNSYPFKFTSHWLEGDTTLYPHSYGHNMGDAVDSLHKIVVVDANLELGLWWGRAGQVMYDWDTPEWERLDPDNPLHVTTGFKELDLAVAAGATTIGLDAFKLEMYPWDAYRWLKMMRAHSPNVKFASEGPTADFLNTLGANFIFMKNSDEIHTPHYLAGFLLPGHETWATPRLSTLSKLVEAERLANMGYNTLIMQLDNINDPPINNMLPYTPADFAATYMPFPDLATDQIICLGEKSVLRATHQGAQSYLWSTGDTTDTIEVSTTGTYWVSTSTISGCVYSDTILVTLLDTPTANFAYQYVSGNIDFTNTSTNASFYSWDINGTKFYNTFSIPQQPYTPGDTFKVTLIVWNDCGRDTVVYEILTSGVENNRQATNNILIYPNPVQYTLNINIFELNHDQEYDLMLYDYTGRLIKKESSIKKARYTLYTGEIRNGLYQLKIKFNDQTVQIQKIIIQH